MANTKTITQNDISFTVDTRGTQYQGWGKKYSNQNNILDGVYDPDGESFGINAVEIDWNGVKPGFGEGDNGITTTGELLGVIRSYVDKHSSTPTYNSVSGGDQGTSRTLALGGKFKVPYVSQNTNGQVGVNTIELTMPSRSTIVGSTSAIGGPRKGIYWNGSNFEANSYSVNIEVPETARFLTSTAVGTATNPVYWDGNNLKKTTYALNKTVPSNAKFITQSSQVGNSYQGVFWTGEHFETTQYSINTDVPEDAVFTDYQTTLAGHYKQSTFPAQTVSALYKVKIDAAGHITNAEPVAENDIINLIRNYLNAHYEAKSTVLPDPTYTAPSAKSGLTYTGNDQQLINAGLVSAGGAMKYSLDGSSWSTSIPIGNNAGSYSVYWKIDADSGYNNIESHVINVTINKANITNITAPSAKSGLSYTGNAQVLINAGSATGGTMQYKVGSGSFTSTAGNIKGTNAGSYTVTYYVKGDDNHNNSSQASITVSIARVNLTNFSVSINDWTEGGTASNPSVSGNTGNGAVTYKYKVSTAADSTYTTTKPSTAGTYTVQAHVVQTTNYNEATATANFTIAAASVNNYYWYVGTIMPSDPENGSQNTGLNKWHNLGASLPTESIEVTMVDNNYENHPWYVAAPHDANFTLYNALNSSEDLGWSKSSINIGAVSYDLWTANSQSHQAAVYLHK